MDKALVAIARQLHEVRERHKAKGFAIEPVSQKIEALMSTEDKEEDEVHTHTHTHTHANVYIYIYIYCGG